MQKLYCYVDETGQDTKGELFLVSVVISGKERDELRERLKRIEKLSGKGAKKWTKARHKQREDYIRQIIINKAFVGHIYYSYYQDTKAYLDLTILSTAKALHDKAKTPYEATIFVDGLKRPERFRFAAGLRKLKVVVKKVRGIRDDSDEFIRLADAFAGFIRDSLEDNKVMRTLQKEAEKKKIIKKS